MLPPPDHEIVLDSGRKRCPGTQRRRRRLKVAAPAADGRAAHLRPPSTGWQPPCGDSPCKPGRPGEAKGIRVTGVGDLLTNIGGCCNPLPGDEIIG
jgi:(p)ppGpp synthase/HD superfamily hydrolase